MFYVVVNADELRKKGVEFFRKTPDGRGIVPGSELRTLGDLKNVDVFASEESLHEEIERQKTIKEV